MDQLTFEQKSILEGSLLGDGHLELSPRSKYPRLKIERAIKDLDYLKYQYNYFKEFCNKEIKIFDRIDKRDNKTRTYCYFRTCATPQFLDYYNKWYINKVRVVPIDLELNHLVLATWFCDDGCVIDHPNNLLTIKLSTENFLYDDVKFLTDKLEERFGIKYPIYKKGNGFVIKASTIPAQLFIKDIQEIVKTNGMIRKYNIWKDYDLDVRPKIGRKKRILL